MTTPHARRRLLALLLGVTACLLALPAMAAAATLTVTGTTYDYDAGAGVANKLNVQGSSANPHLTFSDPAETITVAGAQAANCTGTGTNSVTCNGAPTVVDLNLGDRDDGLQYNSNNVDDHDIIVDLGTGNDGPINVGQAVVQFSTNSATQPNLTVNGGDGDDVVDANGANNSGQGVNTVLNGGNGNDTLKNQTGGTMNGDANDDRFFPSNPSGGQEYSEIMNGGGGEDTADYSPFQQPVSVTIDGSANDGPVNGNFNTDFVGQDGSVENARGGMNSDTLTGTLNQDNKFFGNSARDFLNGGPGDDTLDGEHGNDVLDGGANGPNGDTASYATRTNSIVADNDGVADDGEVGLLVGPAGQPPNTSAENDNILATVENMAGGVANDSLTGDAVGNVLTGNGGDDTLDGNAGGDTLNGGTGDDDLDGAADGDTINGGSGDDTGAGGAGTDTVNGDNGFDRLDGEAGTDTVNGGAGGDTIGAMDGAADTVNCGDGTDNALPDASGDTVNADCEISGSGGGGVGPAGPAGPAGPQGSKGDKGESGSNGSQGPAGPQGPSGPEGDKGAQGPRGEDVSVGCQVAPNSARTRLAVVCDVFRTGSARPVIAKLTRGSKTFGRGSSKIRNNTIRFNLSTGKLSKGRYRLTLTQKGVRLITLGVTIR